MCLSTVMLEKNGSQEKVCEYVSNVKTDGNKITLTDVMGNDTCVEGTILSMDLVKNLIIVKA